MIMQKCCVMSPLRGAARMIRSCNVKSQPGMECFGGWIESFKSIVVHKFKEQTDISILCAEDIKILCPDIGTVCQRVTAGGVPMEDVEALGISGIRLRGRKVIIRGMELAGLPIHPHRRVIDLGKVLHGTAAIVGEGTAMALQRDIEPKGGGALGSRSSLLHDLCAKLGGCRGTWGGAAPHTDIFRTEAQCGVKVRIKLRQGGMTDTEV